MTQIAQPMQPIQSVQPRHYVGAIQVPSLAAFLTAVSEQAKLLALYNVPKEDALALFHEELRRTISADSIRWKVAAHVFEEVWKNVSK